MSARRRSEARPREAGGTREHSIARDVAMRGAAILVAALLLVGVATGVMLHTRAVSALDQALLAAALGSAHPAVRVEVEVEHAPSAIEAWLVRAGDSRLPAEAVARAVAAEAPLFIDVGDRRLVVLPFEVEGALHDERSVAAASAPAVTLGQSVGGFALGYGLAAALAAALALVASRVSFRRAFRPLERTRAEVALVLGLGEGRRLTETGALEVRELIAAVNALLERLDAAHQAQARFTSEAAHELRTPVTVLLGELDVALRAPRDAASDGALLASLREDVGRLRDLVEGLVALARIDSGQIDQAREHLRAGELAGAALDREARALAAAGSTARLEVTSDPELVGHRALLEVALGNLVRNAARHAPKAAIVVRVDLRDGLAVFEVDDAGPGVPAADREALFARFARGSTARRTDRPGLGLGLPIAREVARRHGGDCSLDVSPEGGLRARLTVRALL